MASPALALVPREEKNRPSLSMVLGAFSPNQAISASAATTIFGSWVVLLLAVWFIAPSPILPSPVDVLRHFPALWGPQVGLGAELWTSLALNCQAIALMVGIALPLAYATAVPAMRPLALLVGAGRFNGMVGLPLLLTLWLGDPHQVKVALLAYGMGVFTVPSLLQMIQQIPKESFDHARTLRMGEWRVVWEVVVLGKFDEVVEILRTNISMGWMMLPMVEGMFKSEGGVGALLLNENKHFHLEAVYGIVIVVLALGLLQDYIIGVVKRTLCPYSCLGLEQK